MAKHRITTRRFRGRGIATLEFVLVLPILLLLLFGTMEYGWMLAKQGQIVNAAREGARVGARADTGVSTINSTVTARMNGANLGSSGYSTQVTPGVNAGDPVTVAITVPYAEGIRLTGLALLPVPANLTASVTMSKEGP